MTLVQELKERALSLSEAERAVLVSELLQTLPAILADEDDGVAEALRRETELASNRVAGVDWPALKKGLGR